MSVTIKHEPPHFGSLTTAEGIRGGKVPECVFRQEIDLTEMADEYAKRLQERVDGMALDKAADTLERFGYVKVIRCRDCKWFTPEHRYEEEREYGVMEELVEPPDCGNPERCSHHYDSIAGKVVPVHIVTDPDGFCKWAERRDA